MVWQAVASAAMASAAIAGLKVCMEISTVRWSLSYLPQRPPVIALVDVFHRIREIFLGLGEFAPELQHRATALEVELRLLLEALVGGEHRLVGLLRRRARRARRVLDVDRDRLLLVRGILQPVHRRRVGADEADELLAVLRRPGAARDADRGLVRPESGRGVAQARIAFRLGQDLRRR